MKISDVKRVSEVGGCSKIYGEEQKHITDVQLPIQPTPVMQKFQDDSEPHLGLRDYLASLARCKWYAFFFAIIVFVAGFLLWLYVFEISYTADAGILKKQLQSSESLLQGTDESSSRSIEGDLSYLKSEYVYNVARKITLCIANLSEDEVQHYLELLVAEDIGDTKLDKVSPSPDKLFEIVDGVSEIAESDEKEIEKFWMVIDWNTSKPISFKDAMLSADGIRDAILISSSQARLLIDNFWGEDVTDEDREAIRTLVTQSQSGMLSHISASCCKNKGEISVSSTNLNKNISVFLANLMPSAFISANNRIAMRKNKQELTIYNKLLANTEKQVIEIQKELKEAGIEMEDSVKSGLSEAEIRAYPLRSDNFYEAKCKLAEKLEQKEIFEGLILSNNERTATLEEYYVELKHRVSELEHHLMLDTITIKPALDKINEEIIALEIEATTDNPKLMRLKNTREALLEKYNQEYEQKLKDLQEGKLVFPHYYSNDVHWTNRDILIAKSENEKLNNQLAITLNQIKAIEKQLENIRAKRGYSRIDELNIEYDLMMEKHRQISRMLQDANIKATRVPDMYEWLYSASDNNVTVKDSKYLLILIGFVAVLLGLIFARIVDILDSRVKTVYQVKEISPYPILAHLPKLSSKQRFITADDANGSGMHRLAGNLFGIIGVNLQYSNGQQAEKVIAVTSSLPREGKSFISYNLAAYYAVEGFKSLLLVADRRNPSVEAFQGMKHARNLGFIDYMFQDNPEKPIELSDCTIETLIENFHLLLPGTVNGMKPAKIFARENFTPLLDELSEEYDIIIIDTPPLIPVVDASLILKCVKSALMVLDIGRVKKRDFEEAIKRLQLIKAPVSGLVINRDPHAARRKYYSYYS